MLSVLALSFPTIDPVLIEIGPVAIRWYALAYIAGIFLGYYYVIAMDHGQLLTKKTQDDLMVYAIIGIMLGGRLGYVLFYNAPYYLEHPADIPKIWHGGMAFHGGLLGVLIAFYMLARRRQIPYLTLMDLVACAAPIGLFFGRLANFINGELFGRITTSPLGMVFPNGGPLPRHPSQLYEALLEGLLLFLILLALRRYTHLAHKPGRMSGVFLTGYGCARFFIEQFREPDEQLGFIIGTITMGQLLCLPMIALGLYLLMRPLKQPNLPHA